MAQHFLPYAAQGIVVQRIHVGLLLGWSLALGACHGSSDEPPTVVPPPPPGPAVGLDARPSNLTCVAPARASGGAGNTIAVQRVFPSLTFNQPLGLLQAPGDDSRWFVLEKGSGPAGTALVRTFANAADPATATTFLSLTVNASSEGGLLGLAFHPQWATNRQAFVSYTAGTPMVSYLARYTSNDNGATLAVGTRQEIIRVNQPFTNHNGGHIGFGPDGFLYFGLGDGGDGGDPLGAAQDTTDLLGSMLRLNVNGALPYTIPADNPFVGGDFCAPDHAVTANDCPEIYAWGFRNPWRWSFDSANGDLWVGDVGQGTVEEVDRVQRGGNYGWDCREGTGVFSNPAPSCSTASGLIDPVHQYGRSLGSSITGGFVYRGSALPALVGHYLFADYGSGRIWHLVPNGSGGFTAEELLDTSLSIASFGQGNDGELYVVDIAGGGVYKIVDGGGGGGGSGGSPVPTSLAATGCVNAQSPSEPATGLIPYAPHAPFWSDGATKERWLAIPNGTSIAVGSDGDFTFPNGTVLMKHFRLGGALIETRLFMRHPDGEWAGYTYEWNVAQTGATLVQGGKSVTIGGQSWIYPSGNDCLTCHTAAAGFALGPEAVQLNHDLSYASTGRTANQLRTLDSVALFATPLGDPTLQPAMPDPLDTAAPLGQRARAYLHTNCAGCHRQSGPTPSSMDLRYATLLSATNACDAAPQSGDLGLGSAARIIAPGSPAHSVLTARMNRRDVNGMPPLGSTSPDTAGVALIESWIASLAACQ
jgi:uncharacterized repeat protein (TIGR03806 family)